MYQDGVSGSQEIAVDFLQCGCYQLKSIEYNNNNDNNDIDNENDNNNNDNDNGNDNDNDNDIV